MAQPNQETIHDLLVRNIPRELVMGLEEAKLVGAQRAYAAARGMDDGHLPSVVGQLRHFHMNESFHRALAVADASPSPLRGNQIVTGRSGSSPWHGSTPSMGSGTAGGVAKPENRCPWRTQPSSHWFNPDSFQATWSHPKRLCSSWPALQDRCTASRTHPSPSKSRFQIATCKAGFSGNPLTHSSSATTSSRQQARTIWLYRS